MGDLSRHTCSHGKRFLCACNVSKLTGGFAVHHLILSKIHDLVIINLYL